jgi:peptidoglycan/LPS O-acetylase OafA/YrhL
VDEDGRTGTGPAPADDTISQAGELRSARIESLRAVAALAVLFGHTFAFAVAFEGIFEGLKNRLLLGGGLGVFLFFTLSGYLLFWPFARRAFGGGERIDLGRYARNRALRILPLYWFAVALLYLVQPNGAEAGDWWRFALFLQSYSGETVARLDSPMWSLAVEIQFYVLLPLIAWAVAAVARGSLRRGVLAVLALAGASFAVRLDQVLLATPANDTGALGRYALPSLFFFFATGMLLALARLAWERRPPRGLLARADLWLVASVPLWVLACWDYDLEPATAVASTLVVASCVLPLRAGVLVRALGWKPLAALGVASYSLYIWHVPLLIWITGAEIAFEPTGASEFLGEPRDFKGLLLLVTPIAIAVALVSYRLVEAPFLRLRRRWAAPTAPKPGAVEPAAAAEPAAAG